MMLMVIIGASGDCIHLFQNIFPHTENALRVNVFAISLLVYSL